MPVTYGSTVSEKLERRKRVTSTGCWEWEGARNPQGYGHVWNEGKHELVHRASFRLFNGALAPTDHVCHTCDNPPCFNPAHLFKGTASDNMQDSLRKGRKQRAWTATHCKNGHEFTPANTYTWKHVRQCRRCLAAANARRPTNRPTTSKAAKEKA